jgi:hypothetical protein
MKICNKCFVEKPNSEYHKKKESKDGLMWWCNVCHKEYVKAKYHEYKNSAAYVTKEKERLKQFRLNNPNNIKKAQERFCAKHPGYKNAQSKKHFFAKKQRTPKWLTADDFWLINEAYDLAAIRTKMLGFSWHVDHIVPLNGKLVSGLHVPHNLQVIPGRLNRLKSNSHRT